MLLAQQFSINASKNLGRGAVRFLGKEVNYGELKTTISKLSYLYMNDLGHGARVAFLTHNSPAVVATFLALTNTRSVSIMINPDLPPGEIVDCLKETKATQIAVTSDMVSKVRDMLMAARFSLPIIEIEKKHGGEYDASFTPPPDNIPTDNDPVVLLRTGGVLGKPKFVALNHKQLMHAAVSLRGSYHIQPADRILTTMSWSHPFAFVHGLLFPLMVGATAIADHGLEGLEFLDFLIDAKVSRLVGPPSFFLKLLLNCKNEKRTLPGVKSVTVGMGSLSPEVRSVFNVLKIPAAHCYGQAEAGWTLAMEDTADKAVGSVPGCVGKGLPGIKYKVLDENGDEIPTKGEREGVLAVTGASIMGGYFDRERETKLSIRGTWLHTGDFVRLKGDGEDLIVTFLGRKEDVLRHDGKAVVPDTVDAALRGVAGVMDAAGFVVNSPKSGPVMCCAVVKVNGSSLTEKAVLEACASKLPPGAVPKLAVFTDLIPRDSGGNIHRARLRAQFSGAVS